MTIQEFFLYLLWFEVLCVLAFGGVVWWYIRDIRKEEEDVDL